MAQAPKATTNIDSYARGSSISVSFSESSLETPPSGIVTPVGSVAFAASEGPAVSESRVVDLDPFEDLLGLGDLGLGPGELDRDGAVHNLVIIELSLGFVGVAGVVVDHSGRGERPAEVVLVDFADVQGAELVEHLEQVVAADVGVEPDDPELSPIFSGLLGRGSFPDDFHHLLPLVFERQVRAGISATNNLVGIGRSLRSFSRSSPLAILFGFDLSLLGLVL